MSTQTIVPVILSGGSGTRLWPVSRESFPKQLWPLLSDKSLMQETVLRAHGPGFAAPIVVCNNEHRFLIAEQLRDAGVTGARIMLEPVGRNSAPAIAAAAMLVAETDPDAMLWMMAADASIADTAALHQALAAAAVAARMGKIVTFGMRPTAPETGYGYIEIGEVLTGAPGVYQVARFMEKPDAERAAALASDGRHLWNFLRFAAQSGRLRNSRVALKQSSPTSPGLSVAARRRRRGKCAASIGYAGYQAALVQVFSVSSVTGLLFPHQSVG